MPTHHHKDGADLDYETTPRVVIFRRRDGVQIPADRGPWTTGHWQTKFGVHHESVYLLNGWSRVKNGGV